MKSSIIFGLHAVEMAIKKNPEQISEIHFFKDRLDQKLKNIIDLANRHDIYLNAVSREELNKLCDGNHQGVIATLKGGASSLANLTLQDVLANIGDKPPFLLILDCVQDPHNLGACLRTADAAGVDAIIIPKDKSTAVTPVVRKVACGAAETVPVISVTNLARTMQELKDAGIWIAGSAGDAPQTIYQANLKGPLAIVAGAEGDGMRRLTKENCDFLVSIPMFGSVSSLNVSVAVGVMLFEAVRQRG